MESMITGIEFVATFRVQKNFRKIVYVLTEANGIINHISSSAYNILKMDNRFITTT